MKSSLTILFKIGNRILAQARLLVNSVKIALVIITKRITINFGAPIINRRNVAIVLDKSEAYKNSIKIFKKMTIEFFTLKPSAIAKPAPCNINTPQGNVFDK